jgi:hypothetical protein
MSIRCLIVMFVGKPPYSRIRKCTAGRGKLGEDCFVEPLGYSIYFDLDFLTIGDFG